MKNEIEQYRPSFFEGFESETVKFGSLEELLAIPWIKNFAEQPNFYQFSISDHHLMAIYRGGREWWVVGFVKDSDVGLPKWDHGIYEVLDGGKAKDIPGNEVAWSCGDKVKLKNGRLVKRKEETVC